jgi:malate dehydrogenase (oxaloacetate-decarboxylating)
MPALLEQIDAEVASMTAAGAYDGETVYDAKALAAVSPARNDPRANLLPPVTALREVAVTVALAVALQAHKERQTKDIQTDQIGGLIRAKTWTPQYLPFSRIEASAL